MVRWPLPDRVSKISQIVIEKFKKAGSEVEWPVGVGRPDRVVAGEAGVAKARGERVAASLAHRAVEAVDRQEGEAVDADEFGHLIDIEAGRHHSIDSAVRWNGIFDRQGFVILIAEKAVVTEQLLQVSLSHGGSFSGSAVFLFQRHLHLAYHEGHIRRVFDAKIEHRDAVLIAQRSGSDLEDFAL